MPPDGPDTFAGMDRIGPSAQDRDVMQDHERWQRSDDFVSTPLDLGVVVLNLSDGVYYYLSDTAADIWQLLDRPRTIAEIGDELVAAYEVDRDRCLAAVDTFLDDLAAKRLVERAPR
jgi:hypothetical protein